MRRLFTPLLFLLLTACASSGSPEVTHAMLGVPGAPAAGGNPTPSALAPAVNFAPGGAAAIKGEGSVNLAGWEHWWIDPNWAMRSTGRASSYGPTDVALIVDPSGKMTAIGITVAGETLLAFTANKAEPLPTLASDSHVVLAGDAQSYLLVVNPLNWNTNAAPLFNYQSFGAWFDIRPNSGDTWGGFSFGSVTPVSEIPTTGSAVFKGSSIGEYNPSKSIQGTSVVTADVTAIADFQSRSIAFSTSNSRVAPDGNLGGVPVPNSKLDLSGVLIRNNAEWASFYGPVSTADGALKGSADGTFYGFAEAPLQRPGATELGGTFSVTGATSQYTGAFGAKR